MKQVIKTLVAMGLIAFLISSVDTSEARKIAERLHWWAFLVAFLIMVNELVLSAWKWSRALNMHDISYPFGFLLRVVCAGFFLNNFLPTLVGGDAYRVYRTVPKDGYRSRALSAVLVDRTAGFAMLLTLGAGGALLELESATARWYLVVYVCAGLAGMVLLLALQRGWLSGLTRRIRHLKAFDAIEHNVGRLPRARVEWLRQIGLSLLFQLLSVFLVYWLFSQSGAAVPYHMCAMITATAGMAALIPLSLNGIGLMEGSFVVMATALGVDYEQAVLVSIVRRLMMLFLSLLCGLVYIAERGNDPRASQVAET